eukprot:3798543-Rhodomonas_salina.2
MHTQELDRARPCSACRSFSVTAPLGTIQPAPHLCVSRVHPPPSSAHILRLHQRLCRVTLSDFRRSGRRRLGVSVARGRHTPEEGREVREECDGPNEPVNKVATSDEVTVLLPRDKKWGRRESRQHSWVQAMNRRRKSDEALAVARSPRSRVPATVTEMPEITTRSKLDHGHSEIRGSKAQMSTSFESCRSDSRMKTRNSARLFIAARPAATHVKPKSTRGLRSIHFKSQSLKLGCINPRCRHADVTVFDAFDRRCFLPEISFVELDHAVDKGFPHRVDVWPRHNLHDVIAFALALSFRGF